MSLAIATGIIGLGKSLVDLASEYIEDPDKRAEFALKTTELTTGFSSQVLSTSTIPWVDALVKVMYATRDVVIPLLRPVGSMIATGFAAWAAYHGIELNPVLEASLAGAFPGWIAAREMGKHRAESERTKRHVATERRKAVLREESSAFDFDLMGSDK